MSKWIHRIANIDPEGQTADCSECGLGVRIIYRKSRGYWSCHAARILRVSGRPAKRPSPQAARMYKLKYKFGMNLQSYDGLLLSQNGVCGICGQKCATNRNLAIDHSHNTGEIRGLLCGRCNSGLGFFRDDAELLGEAANYLKRAESKATA